MTNHSHDELDQLYESTINKVVSASIRGDIPAVNRYAAEAKAALTAYIQQEVRKARIKEARLIRGRFAPTVLSVERINDYIRELKRQEKVKALHSPEDTEGSKG